MYANGVTLDLLLTGTTPISHHDPAVRADSNRIVFNRQKQFLATEEGDASIDQAVVDRVCEAMPVPAEIADLFADVSLPEFIGVAVVKSFLDLYNGMNGTGVFTGMERYERLESRLRNAAIAAPTLRNLWDRLCDTLQTPVHGGERDDTLLRLLTVPMRLQQAALKALVTDYRSIVAIARLWHTTGKLTSEKYAQAAGKAQISDLKALYYRPADASVKRARVAEIEVPAISANSLRHQIVREPAWLHLRRALGLMEAEPGRGPVPQGVEALFYNGGNIEAGAKQPTNVFTLAWQIRALYPSLDLLGGVVDSFDLGESRLRLSSWLVCAENRDALAGSSAYDLPMASVSAFDMLDDVTLTRQAGQVGSGQMIWSFETLAKGVQALCRMHLVPYTPDLTYGALLAAVETYLAEDGTVGGQAARGFGFVRGEWLSAHDLTPLEQYEAYLFERQDELRDGLCDGKLGTSNVICRA